MKYGPKFTYKKTIVPDEYGPCPGIFGRFKSKILKKSSYIWYDLFKDSKEFVMTKKVSYDTETCRECYGKDCYTCPENEFIIEAYKKMDGPNMPKYRIEQNGNGKFAISVKNDQVCLNKDGTVIFDYKDILIQTGDYISETCGNSSGMVTQYEKRLFDTREEVKKFIENRENTEDYENKANDWKVVDLCGVDTPDDIDLPKVLADYINAVPNDSKLTIDDLLGHLNIPMEQRTDYIISVIIKQAIDRNLFNDQKSKDNSFYLKNTN